MRILVVGAGRMGALRVEDLCADPRVAEVLVANRTRSRADEVAGRLGARAVDLDAALDPRAVDGLPPIDAAVLTTATDVKGPQLRRLLERRVPVLVEKPLAADVADTAALIDVARASGTVLQVGFQRRFDPGLARIRERIVRGEVGTLYSMHLVSHDRFPAGREFIAGSAGIFRDLHVHDFDVVRWLTDSEIASVYATGQVRVHHEYADYGDVDASLVHVVTESGVQASISGTRHDPVGHDVHVEVFGSRDSLAAGWNHRTPIHLADGDLGVDVDPYEGFVDRFREAFRAEVEAFVSVVAGARENPCPPEAALQAMRVAVACEVSRREGRVVPLSEIATGRGRDTT